MGSVWAAGFLLRRLRAEVGVIALLLALVGVTSFLFASAPRLFNLVADAALVRELRGAPQVARDFQLSSVSQPPVGGEPLATVGDVGAAYLAAFPDSIRGLIAERRFSATTPRFSIRNPPRYTMYLSLRYQDGIDDAIRLVEGRMPLTTGEHLAVAVFDEQPPPDLPPVPGRIEVAVSEATAAETGVEIGDTLTATLDGSDPTVRGFPLRRIPAVFVVVGIFSIADADATVWYADHALQRADVGGSEEFPIAYATALVAPEAYPDLTTSNLPFRYAWRYFVDPERADVAQLSTIVPDLRRIETQNADATFGLQIPGSLIYRNGLLEIIDRYLVERSASEAVLAVAAIGPFALAAGAIAMVAILLIVRRRTALQLTRSRGASGQLMLAAQLWEAVLLAGGAALLGLLLAQLIVPGRVSNLSPGVALATGAAAIVALMAATLPAIRRKLGPARREDATVLPASPRRLVLEMTGVGLAVAGVLLLQQRGLSASGGAPGGTARLDPFLAAVPVLAGAAMGVVAMRVYPLPVRAIGWLAARRRDLVPVLGLRNVGRHAAAANLPLLVLMVTAAFGAFTSVVLSSIDRGQIDAGRVQVGADYRIELNGPIAAAAVDLTAIEGVEWTASAHIDPAATFFNSSSQRSQIIFEAFDLDAYRVVTEGSSIAVRWPPGLADRPATAEPPGTPEAPIPAIISRRLPPGSAPLAPGGTFKVQVGIHELTFAAIERPATFPGIRAGASFVVVSLELLRQAQTDPPLLASDLFVRGSDSLGSRLTAALADLAPLAVVDSRFDRYDALAQAPFVVMVTGGFRIALLVAVLYAALAIIGALALTALRRSQDLAFLRTLGLSPRQALGLTIVEHGLPVALALVPGVALGIWIADVLAPSLGLDAFVGAGATFAIHVDWREIALVAAALVIMVTIAGVASTLLARRAQAVDALRLGGD